MDIARKLTVGLAWIMVLAVAIQFFLAGLGVLGGESIEAHRQWGFVVLHLIPILMFVVAIVARTGRAFIGFTVLLFVLVFLQALWADPDLDPMWLRSFHVFDGLLIFALAHYLAQRATRLVRAEA